MKPGLSEMYYRAARRTAGPIARLDIDMVRHAHPFANHPVVRVLSPLGKAADQMPLNVVGASILGAGLIAGKPALTRFGIRFLAAHFVGIALKTAAKALFARPRPNVVAREGRHDTRLPGVGDPGRQSFPSGHTAGAFLAAGAVARFAPPAAPYAYGAAVLVGLVQIPERNHFFSDIVAGAILGLAADALTERGYQRWQRARSPS